MWTSRRVLQPSCFSQRPSPRVPAAGPMSSAASVCPTHRQATGVSPWWRTQGRVSRIRAGRRLPWWAIAMPGFHCRRATGSWRSITKRRASARISGSRARWPAWRFTSEPLRPARLPAEADTQRHEPTRLGVGLYRLVAGLDVQQRPAADRESPACADVPGEFRGTLGGHDEGPGPDPARRAPVPPGVTLGRIVDQPLVGETRLDVIETEPGHEVGP